jgi:hypothetical protein
MGRLVKFLAVKSVLELGFVAGLAINFYLAAFPTSFRGSLDVANATEIAGWAIDLSAPETPVNVQLYTNGRFVAQTEANAFRPDIVAAGLASNPLHGFVFRTPQLPPGHYDVRVYAPYISKSRNLGTLQEIGNPASFDVR